ncbi:sugar nucleotide-binding protein [Candidatus Peribacteria bacterium]|jgi:3,5-epimerase/4-reductase|nr:sugar nucleotide-binding protein [Candidatus Peribacteria bacterium]MBT4021464.1 sugar nucleotide-binding protein [Candidatus Peribacteria bacterium]MBT4240374.1 sugar nucleotide-binding protein [Candidatus Peribacteria bacterium]MBT4473797.1 sugar nucleotide-binding protein [Candidatus Peribacteria bacterium]
MIFGPNGFIGKRFMNEFDNSTPSKADIADKESVIKDLEDCKPDCVINCAGKTGRPNVDWCEDNKLETMRANVEGPLILLDECMKRNIYFVHLSTGCVYTGDNGGKGFSEDDPPNFTGSFYSRTKGWSDQIMHDFPVLNLRLRMPLCDERDPRNLIMKLSKYQNVLDVENSITYVPDLIRIAKTLIEKKKIGTYNIINPGPISPYRIMQLYKEIVDPAHEFNRMTLEELPNHTKAGRSNCTLNTDKLKNEGIELEDAESVVIKALNAYKLNT